jgi:hypothetical protein
VAPGARLRPGCQATYRHRDSKEALSTSRGGTPSASGRFRNCRMNCGIEALTNFSEAGARMHVTRTGVLRSLIPGTFWGRCGSCRKVDWRAIQTYSKLAL